MKSLPYDGGDEPDEHALAGRQVFGKIAGRMKQMSYASEFERLIIQSNELPPGKVCVELIEQAIRIADVHLTVQEQFVGRTELIRACFRSGIPRPMLAALTWCLAAIDRNEIQPHQIEFDVALWQCKHAVTWIPNFNSITYEQFEALLADVLKRYSAAGASPRAVYQIAAGSELSMGHPDRAVELSELGQKCVRDRFSESHAWELYFDIELLFYFDRAEEALEKLEPIWENPARAEGVFNHFVTAALFPLLECGQEQFAGKLCARIVPSVVGNLRYLDSVSQAIAFYACIGESTSALSIIDRTLMAGLVAHSEADRLFFSHAVSLAMKRLQNEGRSEVTLKIPADSIESAMPEGIPVSSSGVVATARLESWLSRYFTPDLDKFNLRNGNQYVSSLLEKRARLMR